MDILSFGVEQFTTSFDAVGFKEDVSFSHPSQEHSLCHLSTACGAQINNDDRDEMNDKKLESPKCNLVMPIWHYSVAIIALHSSCPGNIGQLLNKHVNQYFVGKHTRM